MYNDEFGDSWVISRLRRGEVAPLVLCAGQALSPLELREAGPLCSKHGLLTNTDGAEPVPQFRSGMVKKGENSVGKY